MGMGMRGLGARGSMAGVSLCLMMARYSKEFIMIRSPVVSATSSRATAIHMLAHSNRELRVGKAVIIGSAQEKCTLEIGWADCLTARANTSTPTTTKAISVTE